MLILGSVMVVPALLPAKTSRARELGILVGQLPPGPLNALTDVPGVRVGHRTLDRKSTQTGVTAILPHGGNLFQRKLPAAVYVGNGFGKLAGSTQVQELGELETPIILTNTLSVGTAVSAVVRYTLAQPGNEKVVSVNAVVGETNDSQSSAIRAMAVSESDVLAAIEAAQDGPVPEGSVGAGRGTTAFGFKSGIGTASRRVATPWGKDSMVGVLVQTNFGGDLVVAGVPIGRELRGMPAKQPDGSCMMVVATDAPLDSRNLARLAKRALAAMAKTGSYYANGSGDYAIAFTTAYTLPHDSAALVTVPPLVPNREMSRFFQAVMEAAEEAIYNSLFAATPVGRAGKGALEPVPIRRVLEILAKHR